VWAVLGAEGHEVEAGSVEGGLGFGSHGEVGRRGDIDLDWVID
jgi:hypothetical protein